MSALGPTRVVWLTAVLASLGMHSAALLWADPFVPQPPAPALDPAPVELVPSTLAAVEVPASALPNATPTAAAPAPATPQAVAPAPAVATAVPTPAKAVASIAPPPPAATAATAAYTPPAVARLEPVRGRDATQPNAAVGEALRQASPTAAAAPQVETMPPPGPGVPSGGAVTGEVAGQSATVTPALVAPSPIDTASSAVPEATPTPTPPELEVDSATVPHALAPERPVSEAPASTVRPVVATTAAPTVPPSAAATTRPSAVPTAAPTTSRPPMTADRPPPGTLLSAPTAPAESAASPVGVEPPKTVVAQASLPAAVAARPAALDAAHRAELEALLAAAPCSRIELTAASDGIRLEGFVPDAEVHDELLAAAAAIVAPLSIDSRIQLQPWPFCDYLGLAAAGAGPGTAELRLDQPDGIYHLDDYLAVEIVTALDQPGYLYVDFVSTDGRVFHLLPNALAVDNRVAPTTRDSVRLGVADAAEAARSPERRHYRVGEPIGTGMLLVHLTERPLFSEPREEVEPTAVYRPALETALATRAGGFGRTVRFLEIRP